ncbi:MAG: hypothetical protein EP298_07345 [Gammaproteobacteria bacterium]|nr:MAG: hypothetical protein EP298_07345 [Gammaproteobacteria bacterium]UTW42674.1 hypothetical protein KFE69_00575 [bacterium SCSIO 12844]
MSKKNFEEILRSTFFKNKPMSKELYEFELKEHIEDTIEEMNDDKDDFVYAITTNNSDVAMFLVDNKGGIYINEKAIFRLKKLWGKKYKPNINKLMSFYSSELANGTFPIHGVKLNRN